MNTEHITMRAEQLGRHKKVFTRWINIQLAKANPALEVKDLTAEFKDGHALLALVEVLLGIEVPRQEATLHVNQVNNVHQAMRYLERNKVNTLGITAGEICAGDQRAILSLVWSIILRFQINEAIQPDVWDHGVDSKLMNWCQERLKSYKEKVRISDLTTSWSDGLGFNAILHSFNPVLFDFDAITSWDPVARLKHAFNLATTIFDIPKLFDHDDIDRERPDKSLITLFLSYLYLLEGKEFVAIVINGKESDVITKTHQYKTVTTMYERTDEAIGASYETTVKATGVTSGIESSDSVFYDVKKVKEEGGRERVLHVYGFPAGIQIEERRAFVVSPFRGLSSSSRTSSSTSRNSDTKEQEEEVGMLSSTLQGSEDVTHEFTTPTTESNTEKIPATVKGMEAISNSAQPGVVSITTSEPCVEDRVQGTVVDFPDSSELESESYGPKYLKSLEDEPSPTRYKTEIQINLKGGKRYPGSNFVDYLRKRLEDTDQTMYDLECTLRNSDKDSMDLKATKNALDLHKELATELESAEVRTYDALDEGRCFVVDKCFDKPHEDYFTNRLNSIERRIKSLVETTNQEHQRLFDLYMILLKQHLERMNDWLVRAESQITLNDYIEPVYEDVQIQMANHQKFQEDLAKYSMVNMIFDLDLDDPVIDETVRDWVKVLSERWAAVWNWAEEWMSKLSQALVDWNQFREEENAILSWLSSKEQTLDMMNQTDITDTNQVKTHLNWLQTLEHEMVNQAIRFTSLRQTGEQLIQEADYHNSAAKSIREQMDDFDRCWLDITNTVRSRKQMLEDSQAKFKQMGSSMREIRSWMADTETFLNYMKYLQEEKQPERENDIQKSIELKCEERDRKQLEVDEITKLEKELSEKIDKTSTQDLRKVTRLFIKRWNGVSLKLYKYRNDEFPFITGTPDDCFLLKFLKRTLATNGS